jgi:hypothetical protein
MCPSKPYCHLTNRSFSANFPNKIPFSLTAFEGMHMTVVKLTFDQSVLPHVRLIVSRWVQLRVVSEEVGSVCVRGSGTIIDVMLVALRRYAKINDGSILVEELA